MDIIVTVNDGKITLEGANLLSTINIEGTLDTTSPNTVSSDETLIIDKDESDVTLDSGVKVADASNHTKPIKITGNENDNKIIGGKKNDILDGAGGSDTLTGGKGKDTFVYAKSSGKDVITDYTAGQDKIKITSGSISKTTYSGKDVIFKIGTGTLTVKNGKGKKITIENASGKTTTQKYSSNVSKNISELWFAEENNFVTADNLDTITQNNLTPTALEKISSSNYETLTTENNFVTYSNK